MMIMMTPRQLTWIICLVPLSALIPLSAAVSSVIFEPTIPKVEEHLNLTFNATLDASSDFDSVILKLTARDADLAVIEQESITLTKGAKTDILVKGKFIGYAHFDMEATAAGGDAVELNATVLVVGVLKSDSIHQTIFTAILAVMVVIGTFMMGTQLDFDIIKGLMRRPVAILVGITCQFVIMPLTAYAWGEALLVNEQLALGFFSVGCSPGGGTSNMWTILLEGNLNLSMAMTFFSNILALVFMPLWLLTLAQYVIIKESDIVIPFDTLAISLAGMIIPTAIGYVFRRCLPKLADYIEKYVMKYVTFVFMLIIGGYGLYAYLYAFQMFTWRIVTAGLLLPWTGFALAYLAAWIFKQDAANRITIAIETGIQNASIGLVLLKLSLGLPDGDIAAVMPVAAVMFTPLPLAILLGIKLILKWCKPDMFANEKEKTNLEKEIEKEKSGGSLGSNKSRPKTSGSGGGGTPHRKRVRDSQGRSRAGKSRERRSRY